MARRKAGRRAPKKARPAAARSKAKTPARRAGAGRVPDRRKSARETLRLRAINPMFTVSDLERSLRFYTDVLGFVEGERYTGDNGKLQGVMLKAGVCELGLSQDDWARGRDRQRGVATRMWCVTVQDVDALARRIIERGHTLTQEPKNESWGGRSIALDDPDGFHLSFYRP